MHVEALVGSGGDVNELNRESCLLTAIKGGYRYDALQLVLAGVDVHTKDPLNGWTALHWACFKGFERVVEALIDLGSQVDEEDHNGRTPLMVVPEQHKAILMLLLRSRANCKELLKCQLEGLLESACDVGDVFVVLTLIKNGCSISLLSKEKLEKILLKACDMSDVFVVHTLLENGCSINILSREKQEKLLLDAWYAGIARCDVFVVHTLIENGCSISILSRKQQEKLLLDACNESDVFVIHSLVENGCSVSILSRKMQEKLLFDACNEHDVFVVHSLIKNGCSNSTLSREQQEKLLRNACHVGDMFIVHSLLENGCSVSILSEEEQEVLLHSACHAGDVLAVEGLLTVGCNVNFVGADGCTPIIVAVREGYRKVTLALLEAGADIHMKDGEGWTALHWASDKGVTEVVQMLTDRGSPTNEQDRLGYTPLKLAEMGGNRLTSLCLLRAGVSCIGLQDGQMKALYQHAFDEGDLLAIRTLLQNGCNLATYKQEELLHCACHNGDTSIVEAVITNGCNVNCVNAIGCTPLMSAAREGQEEVVKKLILAGAKVGIQDAEGDTALHIAATYNHIHCCILLAEGGASIKIKNKLSQAPIDIVKAEFKEAIKQALSFTTRKALCIIGNAEIGKSTLIASLQAENNTFLGKILNRFKRVSDHRQRTAGIETIPHCSQRYGEVLFFDFAGQDDYHGPHQMFLESLLSKPGVSMTLLLLVKTTEDEESILHQLHRWLSPLALMSTTASPPQVIVIGSFLDKVKSKNDAIAKLTRCVEATRKDLERDLVVEFVGMCFLNCRKPQSKGINQLCNFLQEIPIPEFRATHTQYSLAWVLSQIRSSCMPQAVQLQEFSTWVQDNKDNLPRTMPPPEEVCWDLSASGHALYLPNKEDIPKSWLVLDLPSILHDVYGTLFSQSEEIVNEFGLLHHQHLVDLFPDLDLEMVLQLLISLEFCIPVDPSVLIVDLSKLTKSTEASGWLFFPALISAKPPQPNSESLTQQSVYCLCWQLRTMKKYSISAHVLQTILLRLAAHFVVKQQDKEGVQQHYCSVWWNGIKWQSTDGIETTVHISNRMVRVIGTSITSADKSCQYLTEVISDILSTIRRLSPKLAASAYIVHRPVSGTAVEDITDPKELFPVEGIRKSVKDYKEFAFSLQDSKKQWNTKSVASLLGGYTPSQECIERINWIQPETRQCQSSTDPDQPDVLSQEVYTVQGYLILFRKYVSRNSGKGRAVLEGVGLDANAIGACFGRHPLNEEESVQYGLSMWADGHHGCRPTWRVLLDAMVHAGIGQQHCQKLKEELYKVLSEVPAKPSQPQTSAEPSQPKSPAEQSQPHLSAEPNQLQLSDQPSQPQMLAGLNQPHSTGEPGHSQSLARSNQPQSSLELSQPQSSAELSQPEPNYPQSLAEASPPQSSAEPNYPQSLAKASPPQSSAEPIYPQSLADASPPQSSAKLIYPQSLAEASLPQSSAEPNYQLLVEQSQLESSTGLNQPQSLNELAQHQLSAELSQSQLSAEPNQPQLSAELNLPQLSAEPSQPELLGELGSFQSLARSSQPKSPAEPSQPHSSAESNQPDQPSDQPSQPQMLAGLNQPRSTGEPGHSQSLARSNQPQSSLELSQPQLSAELSQPQSSAELSLPHSSAELSLPQSSAELSQPQASAKLSQPEPKLLLAEARQPQSSVEPNYPQSLAQASPPQSSAEPNYAQSLAEASPPQSSAEPIFPQLLAEASPPQSSVEPNYPQSLAEARQPQSSVESNFPHSLVEVRQPQSSAEPNYAQSLAKASLPQSSVEPNLPQSLAEASPPQSSAEPIQPQLLVEQSQLESSTGLNQPQSLNELYQHQLSAELSQSQLSAELNLPQLSAELSQLQSAAGPSQHQLSAELGQPQSSAGPSQHQMLAKPRKLQSTAELNQHQLSAELNPPQSFAGPSNPQLPTESDQCQSLARSNQLQASSAPSQSQSSVNLQGARALIDVLSMPDMTDIDELVVTPVAANWQKVALKLGVEGCVSEAIAKSHSTDSAGACRDMLCCWLRGDQHTGAEKRMWSTLLTALNRAGFVELEDNLRRKHFRTLFSSFC